MRISDVHVGDGVFRLNVEPTSCFESVSNIPTPVMDDIARDVARRMRNEQTSHTCGGWGTPCHCAPRPTAPIVAPQREPDGFDAHIDRPKRENYGGWDAEWGFQNDLRKYREAERAVKACNWPCREPMKGAPTHQPCGCGVATPNWNARIEELKARQLREARLAEQKRKNKEARINSLLNQLVDTIREGF